MKNNPKDMTDAELRKALRELKDMQKKAAASARAIVLEMQRRVPLTSALQTPAVQPQSAKQG